MTVNDDQTLSNETTDVLEDGAVDELAILKQRARMLGVEFSNNIGIDTLRERVRAKIENDSAPKTDAPAMVAPENVGKPVKSLRQELIDENMKLVRVRITNLDPKKKDRPGEIFTIANELLGTVRKYIPYGEVTDNGYHIPYCIYLNLLERKFLNLRTIKGKDGKIRIEQSWAQEFAMEILPPLTPIELAKLAAAQAAAGGVA